MKRSFLLTLAMLAAAAALPPAVFAGRIARSVVPLQTTAQATTVPVVTTTAAPPATTTATTSTSLLPTPPAEPEPPTITVLADGILTELDAEAAVAAVVAAEMPALFPAEALKAQAVAARTYLAYRAAHPVSAHPEAVICDDPSHCCALADLDTLAADWGESGGDYAARITDAVEATAGEILTFGGEPIMAVFHAMSAAYTNSAVDVWGGNVPYLVSVAAPVEEAELAGYADSAVFSAAEFRAAFLSRYPKADLAPKTFDWFTDFDYAVSGLLRSVNIGGVTVSGGELRALCGLRSAAITVTQGTDRIRFDTVGYGHGVGMSQHGAKVLALRGLGYEAILAHYYTGAELAG